MFVDKLETVEGQLGAFGRAGLGVAALPVSSDQDGEWLSISTRAPSATGRRPGTGWVAAYRRQLVGIDLVAVIVALALALTLGSTAPVAAIVALGWFVVAVAVGLYGRTGLDSATGQYGRLAKTSALTIAGIASVGWLGGLSGPRGPIAIAIAVAFVLSGTGRLVARRALMSRRAKGRASSSVIVVGDGSSAVDIVKAIARDTARTMRVVGACIPTEFRRDREAWEISGLDVAVLGDLDSVLTAARMSYADTVVVAAGGGMSADRVRSLSWQLEGSGIELVIAAGATEIAAGRFTHRPAPGLAMFQIRPPRYAGAARAIKSAFERTAAVVALLGAAPVLAVITVLIRATSSGPALFRQTRVGRDGREFTMYKFRSMYLDAEERKAELTAANEAADGLLFKIRNDPRITAVGRQLRKYSLDELPQLLNVALGSMSLVGPRPPLPDEVAQYDDEVRRRLLVKPGLTGLWQVSGRSDLSWEESVRLDLRYVENWSICGDLHILWRTVGAVAGASGSY